MRAVAEVGLGEDLKRDRARGRAPQAAYMATNAVRRRWSRRRTAAEMREWMAVPAWRLVERAQAERAMENIGSSGGGELEACIWSKRARTSLWWPAWLYLEEIHVCEGEVRLIDAQIDRGRLAV